MCSLTDDTPGWGEPCPASLQHAHGITECVLNAGHSDNHRGYCDICEDFGDPAELSWEPGVTAWPI